MLSISFVGLSIPGALGAAGARLSDPAEISLRLIADAPAFPDAVDYEITLLRAGDAPGDAIVAVVPFAPVATLDDTDLNLGTLIQGGYSVSVQVRDGSQQPVGAATEAGFDVGSTRYEAEDAALLNDGIEVSPPVVDVDNLSPTDGDFIRAGNASNGEYVDPTVPSGQIIEFTVNVREAGDYDIAFGYGLETGNRPMRLDVNGNLVDRMFDFDATGAFETYGEAGTRVALNAGDNTIRLTANGFSGPNLDYLEVTPADPTVFVFQAEDLATGNNNAINPQTIVDPNDANNLLDTYRIGAEASDADGVEGGAYLDWAGSNETAQFSFEAPGAGTYAVRVTYAHGSGAGDGNRSLDLELVGDTVENLATFTFARTDGANAAPGVPTDIDDLGALIADGDPAQGIRDSNFSQGWEGYTVEEQQIQLDSGGPTLLQLASNARNTGPNIDKIEVALVSLAATGPTGVSVADNSVVENDADAEIGAVEVADPDGGTYTFEVFEDSSLTPSTRFAVENGVLKLTGGAAVDFETDGPTLSLRVVATEDGSGATAETTFDLLIGDVDETPPAPFETIYIQGESGTVALTGGNIIDTNQSGFTGTGFIDFSLVAGDSAEFTVNVAEAGTYALHARYATSTDRPLDLSVNGDVSLFPFPSTGDFTTWETSSVQVELQVGDNLISLTTPGTPGTGSTGPNVDAFAISLVGGEVDFVPPEVSGDTSFTVQEGQTVVGQVTATDDLDTDLEFSIQDSADGALFQVDGDGNVSFLVAPGSESAPVSYTVTVEVSDGVNTTEQTLTVDVIDPPAPFDTIFIEGETLDIVAGDTDSFLRTRTSNAEQTGINGDSTGSNNTGFPNFDEYGLRPGYSGTGYLDINNNTNATRATVEFDAPAGTYDFTFRVASSTARPMTIKVGDQEATLENNDTGGFEIWGIRSVTLTLPDGPHTLEIQQDGGAAPNFDVLAISAQGADVDLTPPTVANELFQPDETYDFLLPNVAVDENTQAVIQINGSDPESPVTYSVKDVDDGALFAVDAAGNLSFITPPDFEGGQSDFRVTVIVSNGGTTTEQELTVSLNDVEEAPTLTGTAINSSVAQGGDLDLTALVAADEDADDTAAVVVRQADDSPLPAGITFVGGILSVDETVTPGAYTLEAVAVSNGTEEGDVQPFTLTVTGPVDVEPSAIEITPVAFDENVDGALVGTVEVVDPDTTYVAANLGLAGTDASLFVLVDNGGTIELRLQAEASLDAEAVAAAEVEVTLGGLSSGTFNPVPTDVNEAPTLTGSIAPATVPANGGNVDVSSLMADDQDVGDAGNLTLIAREVGGEGELPEGIDFDGAQLIVAPETAAAGYLIEIVAVDPDGAESAPVVVSVTVEAAVDEPATAVILTPVPVAENADGAVVATVEVIDPDTTYLAAQLTVTGTDAALFELVDGTSGVELKLFDGLSLDFEAGSQPDVTVSLGELESDPLGFDLSDVDEAPSEPAFEGAAGFLETVADGTVLGDLSATDPEGDDVTYTTDDSRFEVNGQDELVVAAGADFAPDAGTTIDVVVTASEGDLETSTTLSFDVEDVDLPLTEITVDAVPALENVDGVKVADVVLDDTDTTYDLGDFTLLGADAGLFEVANGASGFELKLKAGNTLDFEAQTQPSVVVAIGELESAPFTPQVEDEVEFSPEQVLFDNLIAYSSQNKPEQGGDGITVEDEGATVTLSGNLWQRAIQTDDFTIGEATKLVFTVQIGDFEGEMIGVSFDTDENIFDVATSQHYVVAGTQSINNSTFVAFDDLRGTDAVTDLGNGLLQVSIDLSELAGRTVSSVIVFADDDQASNGLGSATFSNMFFTESDEPATAIIVNELTVTENVQGALVANVSVVDPDTTYVAADLALVGADADQYVLVDGISGIELRLAPDVALDFEAGSQPSVEITLGGLSSGVITPTVSNAIENGQQVFFGGITGYSTQNEPEEGGTGVSVSADQTSVTLDGNLWQRAPVSPAYMITDETTLSFDVNVGTDVSDFVGIGFDTDENPFDTATSQFFVVSGTQGNLTSTIEDLRGTPAVEDLGNGNLRVTIDLSGLSGQTVDSIIVLADDDQQSNGLGTAIFSNMVFSEPGGSSNTPPEVVGSGFPDLTINEDQGIELALPFEDPDDDPLTYDLVIEDAEGNDVTDGFGLTIADGTLSGTPVPSVDPGVYTVSVTASDASVGVSDDFELTILNVNEQPIVGPNAFEPLFGTVGQSFTPVDLDAYEAVFSDPDNDTLTFRTEGLPDGLFVNAENQLVGVATETGTGSFKLIASDPLGLEAELDILLEIEATEPGDVTVVEMENFTQLDENGYDGGFFRASVGSASGDQIIQTNVGQSPSVQSLLSANGVAEGWYTVEIVVYDETDDSAQLSIDIGGTTIADGITFDGIGEFLNNNNRGGGAQSGNLKKIGFTTPVFIDANTIATVSGVSNFEVLRLDQMIFTQIENPNQPPEAITVDDLAITENVDGDTVGTISATDPDGDDALITFEVDDARFEVTPGNVLKLVDGESVDFETEGTVDLLITATDEFGQETSATVTVTVGDVNEAPGAPTLNATAVDENDAGAIIGSVGATDPENDDLLFTVDDSRFEIVNGQLKLVDGESLNFEDEAIVDVEITAADSALNETSASFQLTVGDVNDAPTLAANASLDDASFVVGTANSIDLSGLGAADEDATDTPVYAVREAGGGTLPAGIEVVGTDLIIPDSLAIGDYDLEIFAVDDENAESSAVAVSVTIADEVVGPFETVILQAESGDVTPVDGSSAFRSEAEPEPNGTFRGGSTGTGYLDFGNTAGDTWSIEFDVPAAGQYDIHFRYASSGPRPADLTLNGATTPDFDFPGTADPDGGGPLDEFDNWQVLTQTFTLQADTNTLSLAIPAGDNSGINLDAIAISEVGTPVDFVEDVSADEDGNLAAAPVIATVEPDDLGAVEFQLTGVDADIVLYEVSTDGGATFTEAMPDVANGTATFTLDLSAFAAADSADVTFRVTDDAGNFADESATVTIEDEPVQAFSETIQLEGASPRFGANIEPNRVTITDTNIGADGIVSEEEAGLAALTQPRDPNNPEEPNAQRGPDGLWDGFNGAGYLDMGGNVGDAFSFEVDVPSAGTYTFDFRYANSGSVGDRPLTIAVGETPVIVDTLAFASTTAFDVWGIESVDLDLQAGVNVITLTNTITNGPNIDQVEISRDGDDPDVPSEPGPRETILINFQDGTAPKAAGYLVANFEGFADQGNGQSYGFVTEASATDADGTTATPIDGNDFPAIAINERNIAGVDARLLGYAHFDLGGFPTRTAWEIALEDGFYEVTISVGDTGGPNDSDNQLDVEGVRVTGWVPTDLYKSQLITVVAEVTDGFLTLSAEDGSVTEMQYIEIRELPDLTPGDGNDPTADYGHLINPVAILGADYEASIAFGPNARPDDINPNASFAFDIEVVEGRFGVLETSLNNQTVQLYETLTGALVDVSLNTTGGFDAVVINPDQNLKEFTSYTLVLDGVLDQGPNDGSAGGPREFEKYTTTFVTGEAPEVVDREVAFTDTVMASEGAFASVTFSPDGSKLYVSTLAGSIIRWDLDGNGEIIDSSRQEYTDSTLGDSSIIGLVFDPNDPNKLWITANAGGLNNAPAFSGRIVTVDIDPDDSTFSATTEEYAVGLPRSRQDHLSNSLAFRENPDYDATTNPDVPTHLLYLIQGSNSAMGAPDGTWGYRAERALSAAVLEIDPTVDVSNGPIDLQTEEDWTATPLNQNPNFTLDPLNDPSNPNEYTFVTETVQTPNGPVDYKRAFVEGFYNPFEEGAPVTVFAGGPRNAYDLVPHSNGFLYVPTNGSAGGANAPDNPDTAAFEGISGIPTRNDYLFAVEEGGYYGHPNPVRGEFILNGGNPTSGTDENETPTYNVGTQPEANYRGDAFDFGRNVSPNGAAEFTSNVFGSNLQGAILVTQYSGPDNIIALTPGPDGNIVDSQILSRADGSEIKYSDPLDLVVNPETGQVYLVTFNRGNGQSQLVLLNPDAGDPTVDDTADVGNDLALTVVNSDDPANVIFQVTGLDADIESIEISFDGGTTTETVTLNNGQFTQNLSSTTGEVTATLIVQDEVPNTAQTEVTFTPGEPAPTGNFIDGVDFTPLNGGAENATNNAGFDGAGFLDLLGAAGDKAQFTYVAANAGTHELTFILANGSGAARPIAIKANGETVTIDNTITGADFTDYGPFVVELDLVQGVNVVVIEQLDDVGGPNIDSVTIVPPDPDTVPNDGTEIVDGVTFTIYEAENAALSGQNSAPVIDDDPRGQSGGEFVDFDGTGSQTITWTIEVAEAGDYDIDVLYALSTTKEPRPATLSVNGNDQEVLPFLPNSDNAEDDWGPQSATVSLNAGVNTIAITVADASLGPNTDYLRVSQEPVDVFVPDFAAIDGETRIELEQTADNSTRVVNANTVDFFFTVAASGAYALDLAANGGAPDGGTLTIFLNGQQIATEDYPDGSEETFFTDLVAGTEYTLRVISSAAGADEIDYLDVQPAPGNENADIEVQSNDPTFLDNRLHFSWIDNPANAEGPRAIKDTAVVTISNSGTEDLEFLDAEIATFAKTGAVVGDAYQLADPTVFDGLVLAAGQSIDVTVLFDGDEVTGLTSNENSVVTGALTLITNDADSPEVTVDLAGFWQSVDEGGQEPNVNEVWQIFGFGNFIEGLTLNGGGEGSTLNQDDYFLPADETEALSPYWRLADGVTEARATQIAAFHGTGGASFGIHNTVNNNAGNFVNFWGHDGDANQMILPKDTQGGNVVFSTELFDNSDIPDGGIEGIFGIKVVGLSSDPTLNPSGSGTPSQNYLNNNYPGYTIDGSGNMFDPDGNPVPDGYNVRVFQAVDLQQVAIDNVYLVIMDYTGINYDYNDNMFVIEGITPVGFGQELDLAGLDDSAAGDRLVFSSIDNPVNGSQAFRNEATFQIENNGFGPLTVESLAITGADAAAFQIVNPPAANTIVQAGQSLDVTVQFIGTDGDDNNAAVLFDAALEIASNDVDEPVKTVGLGGLAQIQSEGGEEPSVQQIVSAFGYTTDVAQGQLSNQATVETVGDEVLAPYFERADNSAPVQVVQMAAYLSQGNVNNLSFHSLDDDDLTLLYTADGQQAQTVLPEAPNSDTVASASFNPTEPFGLKVTVDGLPTFAAWSDPNANLGDAAFDGLNTGGGHYIRYFEAKDADGNVIPNTYIGIQDYPGGGNFDYNDHLYYITNVTPYALTAAEDGNANGVNDALEDDVDNDGIVDFFDPDNSTGGPGDGQTAFNATGTPWVLGAAGLTLDGVQYDDGGQGVAYNDAPGLEGGTNGGRTGSDVEVTAGGNIGWIGEGEWLEYTINVASSGEYELTFLSALGSTAGPDRTITATFENGEGVYETAVFDVDPTGGWTSFDPTETLSLDLLAGEQVMRLTFNGGSQDLQSFTFESLTPTGLPFGGTAPEIGADPVVIDASNYDEGGQGVGYFDNTEGLDGGPTGFRPEPGGRDIEVFGAQQDIAFVEDGEWTEYTLNILEAGTYDLSVNAKTPIQGNSISVSFEDAAPLATIELDDSNGASNGFGGTTFGESDTVQIALEAGVQTLRFTFEGEPATNDYILDFRSFTLDLLETDGTDNLL